MSYGITQFYLAPDRGDVLAVTPTEAGTRFAVPESIAVAGPMTVVKFESGLRTCVRERYEANALAAWTRRNVLV